jgi:hypothetical protein
LRCEFRFDNHVLHDGRDHVLLVAIERIFQQSYQLVHFSSRADRADVSGSASWQVMIVAASRSGSAPHCGS